MQNCLRVINVEPKDNYILRIFLDDDSILDFDVKAEFERIPCYKPLYEYALFKTVQFKNWSFPVFYERKFLKAKK